MNTSIVKFVKKSVFFTILFSTIILFYMLSYGTAAISPPVATPDEFTFSTLITQISLTCPTPEAEIYYTTNGDDPTNASAKYTGKITLNGPTILKAVAYSSGEYSEVKSFIYNKVVKPSPSIAGGEYNTPQTISLTSSSIASSVIYTTDGSDPSLTNGTLYTQPININSTTTVKSISVFNEVKSLNLSSPRPYVSNYNNSWTIEAPSNATRMRVHFLSIETQRNKDFVTTSGGDSFSGNEYKVWSNWVSSNSMTLTLTSDASINGNGFVIDMIEYDTGNPHISGIQSSYYQIYNLYNVSSNIPSGDYFYPVTIDLSAQGGNDIYYTIDGSTPTKNSTKYTSPFTIDSTTTLTAVAYNATYDIYGLVSVFDYKFNTLPTATPIQGVYSTLPNVTLSASEGTTIYYTIDGSTPTNSSSIYSSAIPLTRSTTIKAISYKNGISSPVASFYYYLPPSEPTVNPTAGQYPTAQSVVLSAQNSDYIKYTTNGTVPSSVNGTVYSTPISVSSNSTIKALSGIQTYFGLNINSPHPYNNDYSNTWTITPPADSTRFRVHFSKVETLSGDSISTSVGDNWSGNNVNNIWSSWCTTGSMTVSMSTNEVGNAYGFNIDMIEYETPSNFTTVKSFAYTIGLSNLLAPTSNVPNGAISSSVYVTLSNGNTGDIYYTTNGTDPLKTNGTKYSSQIYISGNTILKAITYKSSEDSYSNISTFNYYFLNAPTGAPTTGTYQTLPSQVSLSTNSTVAAIYYTTNGKDPYSYPSEKILYTGSISINSPTIIYARAYENNIWSSLSTLQYNAPVTPTASANSGTYNNPINVTFTSQTYNYDYIRYTLDGTDPRTSGSSNYWYSSSNPINIGTSKTLKATTCIGGYKSEISTYNYTINYIYPPTANPASGVYYSSFKLNLDHSNGTNTSIYYTLNGTIPDKNSTKYTVPINITSTTSIKAICYNSSLNLYSSVADFNYTLTYIYPPNVSPDPGTYYPAIDVELTSPVTPPMGYTGIVYTTDGSNPNTSSKIYNQKLKITSPTTIKAATYYASNITTESCYYYKNQNSSPQTLTITKAGASKIRVRFSTVSETSSGSKDYVQTSAGDKYSNNYYSSVWSSWSNSNSITISFVDEPDGYKDYYYYIYDIQYIAPGNEGISEIKTFDYTVYNLYEPKSDFVDGTYYGSISVTLSADGPPTNEIYYTMDGTVPTRNSLRFGSPLTLTAPTTIKAVSYSPTHNVYTKIKEFKYFVYGHANLTANPAPGVYYPAIDVQLLMANHTAPTTGVEGIVYTTDGTNPTINSPIYSTPIHLEKPTTVKAATFYVPTTIEDCYYYKSNYDATHTLTIKKPGASKIRVYFDYISETSSGSGDYIQTSAGDKYSNQYYSSKWSSWADGDSITLDYINEDDGANYYYYNIDRIEYMLAGHESLSAIKSFGYTVYNLYDPIATPNGGSFLFSAPVTLSAAGPATNEIYYTLDGSIPTKSSLKYTGTINLASTTTLKAVSYSPTYNVYTPVRSFDFTVSPFNLPTATPAPGNYNPVTNVTLSTTSVATLGYVGIVYTTDGSDPKIDSALYTSQIRLAQPTTIKAATFYSATTIEDCYYYKSNYDSTHTLTIKKSGASKIRVYFDYISETSSGSGDYIQTSAGDKYSNQYYSNQWSSWADGDSITLDYINEDDGANYYYYNIDRIEYMMNNQQTISGVKSFTYNVYNLYTPTATPATGTKQASPMAIALDTQGEGDIYYTLDGSSPTKDSTKYTGPFDLISDTGTKSYVVKAITYNPTYNKYSGVGTFNYNVYFGVAPVIASPLGKVSLEPMEITLTCATPNSKIYYTTNGTNPTAASTLYTAPIKLNGGTLTIKSIGYVNGTYSTSDGTTNLYTTETYIVVPAPVANPPAGSYIFEQDIALSAPNYTGSIFYTTDGTAPTASSTKYTAPIKVSANTTIKAITKMSGPVVQSYSLESPHPYSNSMNQSWTITQSNASKIRVHFNYIRLESSWDHLKTDCNNDWSGTYSDIWSNWKNGNSITLTLTTDGSVTKDGFIIDKIEYEQDINSNISTFAYIINPTLAPKASYPEGTYGSAIQVQLNAGNGCDVYYTTDGSQPTNASTKYTQAIVIDKDTVLKAVAYSSTYNKYSGIGTYNYIVTLPPTISTAGGLAANLPKVSITSSVPGAKIYYTVDGSTPTAASTLYTGQITLANPTIVKAITIINGNSSNVVSCSYNKTFGPEPSIPAGNYLGSQSIELSSKSLDRDIYYTLDGSDPTISTATKYSGPITLELGTQETAQKTIKAIAVMNNTKSAGYSLESPHNVATDYNGSSWTITAPSGTKKMRVHFTKIDLNSLATLTTSSGDNWEGSLTTSDVWSNWTNNNRSVTINFTNNPTKNSKYGFYIDRIEYTTNATIQTSTSTITTLNYNLYSMSPIVSSHTFEYINSPTSITLSCETDGSIYYTLDGSTPTTASNLYVDSIIVDKSMTIKAVLHSPLFNTYSNVYTFKYTFIESPTASPEQGKYTVLPDVILSTNLPSSAKIFYTLDGSIPHNLSRRYTGPIKLEQPGAIRAVVYYNDFYSQPATFIYNMPIAPVSNLSAGEHDEVQLITLNTPTVGGRIYYTLDGSDPSITNPSAKLYTGPFYVYENTVLKTVVVENPIIGYSLNSPHPYPNNYNNTWTVKAPEGTQKMRVHFSRVELEPLYDTLKTSADDVLSGSVSNVWSNWQDGDTMTITMKTDGKDSYYGFTIDMIEYISSDFADLRYSQVNTYDYIINNVISDSNIYQQVYVPYNGQEKVEVRNSEDTRLGNMDIFINNDCLNYTIRFTTLRDIQNVNCDIILNDTDVSGVKLKLQSAELINETDNDRTNINQITETTVPGKANAARYIVDAGNLSANKTYTIALKTHVMTNEDRNYVNTKNTYKLLFRYKDKDRELLDTPAYEREFDVTTKIFQGTIKSQ